MNRKLLVMGIGNLLMGDEGVGVHSLRLLEEEPLPPDVTLVDGGTGGFHLLSYFEQFDEIILIDATMDGRPPGTVSLVRPRFASDFPRSLSAHDIGLRDLIESAILLRPLPPVHLITVSVEELQNMVIELSEPIRRALPQVVRMVIEIVHTQSDDDLASCYASGLCTSSP